MSGDYGGISRRRRRAPASKDFQINNLEQESGSDFLLEDSTPTFILLES